VLEVDGKPRHEREVVRHGGQRRGLPYPDQGRVLDGRGHLGRASGREGAGGDGEGVQQALDGGRVGVLLLLGGVGCVGGGGIGIGAAATRAWRALRNRTATVDERGVRVVDVYAAEAALRLGAAAGGGAAARQRPADGAGEGHAGAHERQRPHDHVLVGICVPYAACDV
jgi:hypothetical protein